jgi:prolyl-tRNA synthetase
MRTRLFLRTAEFLWQEGHTAHATRLEAIEESEKMMNVYADFAQNFMAIPVVKGLKTETERFAGAEETYCIEALMQDGKALQAGTSHFLGQNFAKAFDVKFASAEGKQEYVWGTSWGVSTRLMGALVMTHSDDNGLVLPPNLAPIQVVIVPIFKTDEEFEQIAQVVTSLMAQFKKLNISVKFDNRTTQKPGFKFAEWELKGVPVRIAVGPKDLENGTYEVARRDNLSKEVVSKEVVVSYVSDLLETIQNSLFQNALDYRANHITEVNSFEEFKEVLENKGGFISAHWDGTAETEEKIKDLTKATIRCIPLDRIEEEGNCVFSGGKSTGRVLFAKAY